MTKARSRRAVALKKCEKRTSEKVETVIEYGGK